MIDLPKEGDLYKVIHIFGHSFELRYGYYSDTERHGRYSEAVHIYPDFRTVPLYTQDGYPFVTQMQDICRHYDGKENCDDCYSCRHYCHGDDLLGICICRENRMLQP